MLELCLEIIEGVDMYLRSLSKDNDHHIFCDDEDLILYADTTPDEMLDYTKKMLVVFLKKTPSNFKIDIDTLLLMSVVSFILSIKYNLDCGLCKPYSIIWNIIENEYEVELDYIDLLQKSIRMERKILEQTNFFVNKIDL